MEIKILSDTENSRKLNILILKFFRRHFGKENYFLCSLNMTILSKLQLGREACK